MNFLSYPSIPFPSGTFPQENPAENISDRIGMDKIYLNIFNLRISIFRPISVLLED